MGDVYDAMNRDRRNPADPRAPETTPPEAEVPALPLDQVAGAVPLADDTRPALPLDEVAPRGLSDEPAPTTVTAPPVAEPIRTSPAPTARPAHAPLPGSPKLNGYSPEIIVHHDRGSIVTEQYRAIRTQILARARNRRLQTHVITSSAPEEGKSVTVINLGVAFSELHNQKTLLLEADLRRPIFERLFGRTCPVGLLQLLRGGISEIDQAIQHTVYDNVDFLPAGGREPTHSSELLSSARMDQILDRLRDRYDYIFIDSPPVVTVTDACILGSKSDSTILVIRMHHTPSEIVDRAKRLLRANQCDIAGIILTHLIREPSRYLYRYAYGYGRPR
jgi:capsular exopolysaccharide synthesis family protein